MADLKFWNRLITVLRERWSDPFVGIAIGASSALLVALLLPVSSPIRSLLRTKVPTVVSDAAAWPNTGNLLLLIALGAIAVLIVRPLWSWMARVVRSWSVGLVSGFVMVTAAATFLCLTFPVGSRFFHPGIYSGAAVAYLLATLLIAARRRPDIDQVLVMRRLNLPRDQIQRMRSTVVPDEVFVSVLENPNPITAWNHDWIGRAAFVEGVLQRVIIGEEPVVAITGGFGEGKSSVLYLIEDALRPCPEVIPVTFSSFLPGDEQTLVASLLSSITSAIRERYLVPGLRRDFVRYGRTVAGVIPKMGESLKDLFDRPSQAEEIAEFKDLLGRLPVRVVVLLDEIDRLQQDELRVLLKLLRGVADLPRLRYVCAFNKQAVTQTIAGSNTKQGLDYLEKFFPVELALPKIDEETLRDLFRIRLNAIRQKYSATATEDEKHVTEQWEQLWFTAGKRYFTTLRRLSTYFKNLEAVSRAIGKEVNFFDLSVLEAVRQVSPSLFEFIYGNGKLFYFPSWRISLWIERISINDDEERKSINAAFDTFFSSLDPETREISLQLLSRVFPTVATYQKSGGINLGAPTRDSVVAERLKRIYHPDYFHRYFIYEVPASLYGEQEMARFLARVNEAPDKDHVAQALQAEVEALNKLPLRRADFFDRLPEASQKLKPEQAERLAVCVAGLSSSLAADFLGMGEQGRARALVFAVANRFVATTKGHALLETVIRNAASDGFAADLLFYSVNRDRNNIIREWTNIDAARLQAAFAERMKQKYSPSTNTPIPDDRGSLTAFFTWSKISPETKKGIATYIRSRFEASIAEVAAFIAWLFPGDVVYDSNAGAVVDRLFPVDDLRVLATGLEDKTQLTEIQREALQRFRTLCPASSMPAPEQTSGES